MRCLQRPLSSLRDNRFRCEHDLRGLDRNLGESRARRRNWNHSRHAELQRVEVPRRAKALSDPHRTGERPTLQVGTTSALGMRALAVAFLHHQFVACVPQIGKGPLRFEPMNALLVWPDANGVPDVTLEQRRLWGGCAKSDGPETVIYFVLYYRGPVRFKLREK